MKKYRYYLLLIALCMSCNIGDRQKGLSLQGTAIFVVTDVTDKKALWPLANPILELYHCTQYPDSACWFNLSTITDKIVNVSYTYQLPDGKTTDEKNAEDDPQFRAKAIISFYADVRNSFTDVYKQFDTTKSFGKSECWASISSALINLNQNPATHKYLFVFSDLAENSELWNAYNHDNSDNVQTIAARFIRAYPIPQNLKGITLVFSYLPQSKADDTRFTAMLQVYKFILEQRGASVGVQTNNRKYDF